MPHLGLRGEDRSKILVMNAMTPEEARAYFKRWELVRDVEAAELRRATMETKHECGGQSSHQYLCNKINKI